MKRSAIQRKTPLKATSSLKAKAPMKRSRPKKASQKPAKADSRWRSRKYLDWVKAQPCVICGAPADDPHHLVGLGGLSGMGLTAPDQYVMPVCRFHHDEIHRTPELWPHQWEWITRTLAKAIEDGVFQ